MNFDYREVLQLELSRRQKSRPSYSLRAFARDLCVPAPQLSAILSGKKGLSKIKAAAIARALKLSELEAERFIHAVTAVHGRSLSEKETAKKHLQKLEKILGREFFTVQEARFQVISDWYHLAILLLAETQGFSWDPSRIAQRLEVSTEDIKKALKALEQVGLIRREAGQYKKSQEFIRTEDIPSRAIRINHLQLINKAARAVETQTIQERDIASVTVAIDPSRIPEFKEKLREFREEFCIDANQGTNKTEVYSLTLQFFRLTNGNGGSI